MSYSFYKRGKTKADVLAQVADQFKEIAKQQPVHEKDMQLAYDHCKTVVDAIKDPSDGREVQASVNGYIVTEDGQVTGLSIAAAVSLVYVSAQ